MQSPLPPRPSPARSPRIQPGGGRSHDSRKASAPNTSDTGESSEEPNDRKKTELELEELHLKIAELRRPFWLSPGVVTSLVIAFATGATGYFSGFFQLQLDKAKLETERQETANKSVKLETDRLTLANDRVRFESERLKNERASLSSDIGRLNQQVTTLEKQRGALAKQGEVLNLALRDAMRPRMTITTTELETAEQDADNRFAIVLRNSGSGPIKILPFDLYVDKEYVSTSHSLGEWRNVLEQLDINHGWVHIYSTGGDPRQMLTLDAGAEYEILGIFPSQYTRSRVYQMAQARRRLGIVVCYCTQQKCSAFQYQPLPDSAKTCRTDIRPSDLRW